MKDIASLIKYGMNALDLDFDSLFSLIETAQDYTGDVYERWLAGKIVEVADQLGVSFSRLLVKKFEIYSILSEGDNFVEKVPKEVWSDYCSSFLSLSLVSIGFKGVFGDKDMGDFDWYSGVDTNCVNADFYARVYNEISGQEWNGTVNKDFLFEKDNEMYSLVFKWDESKLRDKNDLSLDAKNENLQLTNIGSLLLYRILSMYRVFHFTCDFGIVLNTSVLFNKDNRSILNKLVEEFEVTGFSRNIGLGEYAFLVCNPNGEKSEKVWLTKEDSSIDLYYSNSKDMLDDIPEKILKGKNENFQEVGKFYFNFLTNEKMFCSLGSDCLEDMFEFRVDETLFKEFVTWWGLCEAHSNLGRGAVVKGLALANPVVYRDLYYNSLVLFVYSRYTNIIFDGNGLASNERLDFINRDLGLAKGYLGFELKELLDFCKKKIKANSCSDIIKGFNDDDIVYLNRLIKNSQEYLLGIFDRLV